MTTGTQGAAPSAAAAATATTAEPPIDMRSDTVTKPTDAMRAVLCAHAYARTERERKKDDAHTDASRGGGTGSE
jgi:hypothetical protein